VFFRNKKGKYTDVEGYNRISQLIEDRQREMSDRLEPEDDFEDEGVLLSRGPVPKERGGLRIPEEEPTVSSTVRPVVRNDEDTTAAAPRTTPAPAAEERRIPFQPVVSEPPAPAPEPEPAVQQAAAPEAPPMPVPDMGQAPTSGCLVSREATWEGKLSTQGNIRVEGIFRGEVETAATLYVNGKARIEGTVHARSILLAGEIEGQVICSDRLEILAGGSARGDIETATLVVHEGAFIDSRFQMHKTESSAAG
jgi:cytoskeletal protein CcmA (bactofilin family)